MQRSTSVGSPIRPSSLPTDSSPRVQNDLRPTTSPIPKGKGSQASPQATPASYKTKDLTVSSEGMARLGKTLQKREEKAARYKNPPQGQEGHVKSEQRKETKSRADKFFKEFKSVVKNIGKATKAGGDAAKNLGGAEHDITRATGGVAAGTQLIETGFDIYLAKVKIDKAKADAEILKDYSPEKLAQLEKASINRHNQAAQDKVMLVHEIGKVKDERDAAILGRDEQLQKIAKLKDLKEGLEIGARLLPLPDKPTVEQSLKHFEQLEMIGKLDESISEHTEKLKQFKGQIARCNQKLKVHDQQIQRCDLAIQQAIDDLAVLKVTGRMKGRTAEKDLNSYNENLNLERAKLTKSLSDGAKALVDIGYVSAIGTAAGEGFKFASGVGGVIVGPLTAAVNTWEMTVDISEMQVQLDLGKKSKSVLKGGKIDQNDGELISIAHRLKLKQKKQATDKGLSASKNFFGALGGIGTAIAGAVLIAAAVGTVGAAAASTATPVGWALCGTAALAAIGYGTYKLARHLNSTAIKQNLQKTLATVSGKPDTMTVADLKLNPDGKEIRAMKAITEKMVDALKKQGITADPDNFTMAEVRSYASKKLLARDTGVATASLYYRFKDEAAAYFMANGITDPTPDHFQAYLDTQKDKLPITSAAGLMAGMGFALKKEEASDMFHDASSSDSIKWLGKKLKLA